MGIYTIKNIRQLTYDTYEMILTGDTSWIKTPGQFVNIKIDGLFLRRPLSVCDIVEENMTLIFKVVGQGTKIMSKMKPLQQLDILCDLGNGYDINVETEKPLLIGGGCGVPPLYYLAKTLIKKGKIPNVILGFNKKDDVFYEKEFADIGCKVYVCCVDGNYGYKGFATDAFSMIDYDYVFTCGPEPMLKAVYDKSSTSGQYSFEERMGCGFGACMGCTCKTKYGYKRICKDGPVLFKEEIIW
ncbi:MAG: dihydroorotate dehydrogenase electron transfer subunit [Clostridia bacterium]|jgi:dihydroorotate dehydrogenase electron transfer subunit|nr:dihydroorotate dehydrogenase electron transfer subunit [Clostridia bacterium]